MVGNDVVGEGVDVVARGHRPAECWRREGRDPGPGDASGPPAPAHPQPRPDGPGARDETVVVARAPGALDGAVEPWAREVGEAPDVESVRPGREAPRETAVGTDNARVPSR